MSEQEAKTKWCPFARYGGAHGQHGNRTVEGSSMTADSHNVTRCIGSACMAWRGATQYMRVDGQHSSPGEGFQLTSQNPPVWEADLPLPGQGYCGLAGKP